MNTNTAGAIETETLNLTKDEILARLAKYEIVDQLTQKITKVLANLGLTGTAKGATYFLGSPQDLGFRRGDNTEAGSIYDESMLKRNGLELCDANDVAAILLGKKLDVFAHIPVKNPEGGWTVFGIDPIAVNLPYNVSFRPVGLKVSWRIDMIHIFRFCGPVS